MKASDLREHLQELQGGHYLTWGEYERVGNAGLALLDFVEAVDGCKDWGNPNAAIMEVRAARAELRETIQDELDPKGGG